MNTIVQSEPIIETAQVVSAAPVKVKRKSLTTAKAQGYVKPKKIADLVKLHDVVIDYTCGGDPECMIWSNVENRIVSSIPILKRDKHNPIDLGDGIALFADNVLCETSYLPSKSAEEMVARYKTVLTRVHEHIGPDYTLLPKAAHIFEADQLVRLHDIDPNETGCSVSYDAYKVAAKPPIPFVDGMRSGSSHIHLGHEYLTQFKNRLNLIKLLDIYVGCASVLTDKDHAANALRRMRYGMAGDHRVPCYGAEWRVLGNECLRSPKLMRLMLDLTDYAVDVMRKRGEAEVLNAVDADQVQKAINTCDVALASDVLKKAELPSALMARVTADYGTETLKQAWGI